LAKNYYHRSFIILKPEETGYSILPGREPTGYCKLEIRKGRGKVQIYVQDLKPAEQEGGFYEVYLISEQDKIEPIKLTSIQVDNRGRGEKAVEFDATNINGTGYSLEMFHALAIIFKSERPGKGLKVGYPLVGYSSKNVKVDLAGRISSHFRGSYESLGEYESKEEDKQMTDEQDLSAIAEDDEVQDAQVQEKVEDDVDAGATDESVNETDTDADIGVEAAAEEVGTIDDILAEQYEDAVDEIDEELVDETVSGEDFEEIDEIVGEAAVKQEISDLVETKAEAECEVGDKAKAVEEAEYEDDLGYGQILQKDTKRSYWDNVKDYFIGLFNTHKSIRPFAEDMGDAEWIRVQLQYPGVHPGYYDGPYYSYAYSPYNQMYYGGTYFDHYIVGLIRQQGEVKYVVYGIPSMYSMIPPTNMMGFSRWVPVRNGYGMGYWLAYIDATTGCLVYPYGKE